MTTIEPRPGIAGYGSRCPFPEECDEDGCSGHCADVRRYGLVTDDMPTPVDKHHGS
jgi:hypothetical protein